jgi:peptidyl-prolyl cis-trans isomerase NIMA-interacting 1
VKSRSFLLGAVALSVGCGASTATMQTRSDGPATLAQHATEPRQSDPTGANPAPPPPTAGVKAPVGNRTTGGNTSTGPSVPDPMPETRPDPVQDESAGTSKAATPPKKIGARHVLIQWMGTERAPANVVRSREQALAVAQEVHRRAKGGEDFARLAIEFSDEPGAGNRGGSLGRFGRGQMVPAFEAAVFKLEIGQISEIVESPFGFHVIQRTE